MTDVVVVGAAQRACEYGTDTPCGSAGGWWVGRSTMVGRRAVGGHEGAGARCARRVASVCMVSPSAALRVRCMLCAVVGTPGVVGTRPGTVGGVLMIWGVWWVYGGSLCVGCWLMPLPLHPVVLSYHVEGDLSLLLRCGRPHSRRSFLCMYMYIIALASAVVGAGRRGLGRKACRIFSRYRFACVFVLACCLLQTTAVPVCCELFKTLKYITEGRDRDFQNAHFLSSIF